MIVKSELNICPICSGNGCKFCVAGYTLNSVYGARIVIEKNKNGKTV